YERTMAELYPRLLGLARLARRYGLGLNIDAEEADRLELSIDLLERLCFEPELAGWDGIGFVAQAYQKRCPLVVDWLIELARRSHRRLMVRLVKGAYWDSEIKRAQVAGLDGYPVYTRKAYTDLAYLACARKLLAAPEAVYPQFATHNAQTLAAIVQMAGERFRAGQYEFQCLFGMGEALYEQVVRPTGDGGLGRPCRIYAPVGTHRTLLAYLVRRLLENGANSSFVNRIADDEIALDELVADPVATVTAMAAAEGAIGRPHPAIPLPGELYGSRRRNSAGIDLSSEIALAALAPALVRSGQRRWRATPLLGDAPIDAAGAARTAQAGATGHAQAGATDNAQAVVRNPADRRDEVGEVVEASAQDVARALETAAGAASGWAAVAAANRAACLERAAESIEAQTGELIGLIVREGGRTIANALGEVREAVDFLRYYAARLRADPTLSGGRPLGPVVCISPWNFPLAIFVGQVAAALAAGNTVIAKPAEQTPLVAAEAVRLLHEAGVPRQVLQFLPGSGETVGAALVADGRTRGVLFTGSTEVARTLQRALAERLDEHGQPPVLVAETGGQNAMIVDSSALIEQAVGDILSSAFDSAGQRCSALRVLCVQDDIAAPLLTMLRGAMVELRVGSPQQLATDIGPVIDAEARQALLAHIERMRATGHRVHQPPLDDDSAELVNGGFVAPTLIELDSVSELGGEVFGPVLHFVRFPRRELARLVEQINATGYGLTFGLQTRIDETVDFVTGRARAGNQYVNRNMIGAVVGVQPFGGEGLSGTGPKAGGPLYLYRLVRGAIPSPAMLADDAPLPETPPGTPKPEEPPARAAQALEALQTWLESAPCDELRRLAPLCAALARNSPLGLRTTLPGPTGERNTYRLLPRASVLCIADDDADRLFQLAHVLAAGTRAVWPENPRTQQLHARLPADVQSRIRRAADPVSAPCDAALVHGEAATVRSWNRRLARRDGPIVGLQACARGERRLGAIRLDGLMLERSLSVDTTAAGGNASLLTID
ncbi:MAG: bifunctional proline dehydrogenase/L-glutamate gamma-semialdehyde dehydrogenase PutA, partial [Limnobacter sp.]|nr:bifunctional proline dehydrogenase/L-glutamate gamma-semialdehyde dehydrogenase PutA [Limnobacter sp.]